MPRYVNARRVPLYYRRRSGVYRKARRNPYVASTRRWRMYDDRIGRTRYYKFVKVPYRKNWRTYY